MNTLEEKLKILPERPGIYIMKDSFGEVLYIGKAVSIKNRVRQYFQNSRAHSARISAMVEKIADFEYLMTDSELEALILEYNLIKKHRPKYNVLLKDDKSYSYIKISIGEDYPRIQFTRRIEDDKARYFGPYMSAKEVREIIELIRKIFPIRSCNKQIGEASGQHRLCLYFHIKQCKGPCFGNVDKEEYQEIVSQACKFLEGKHQALIKQLRTDMMKAADSLEFERAAVMRNRLSALERIMEGQKIVSMEGHDQDVLALAKEDDETAAQILFVRNGALIGGQQFSLQKTADVELGEIIEAFIKQFYMESTYIPNEILLQQSIDDTKLIEEWLSERRGNRVHVRIPQKGEKKELVDMAMLNAVQAVKQFVMQKQTEQDKTIGAVKDLAKYLELEKVPMRIEAFDISNIQGVESVGSMVVFVEGKPLYKDYRRFKIKGMNDKPNDFAAMAQVIERRFKRGHYEIAQLKSDGKDLNDGKFSSLPDLVLVDGGKGQLNAAIASVRELKIENIPLIGLAKEFEHIYIEGNDEPVELPRHSAALHLLQRIRDEAHRFAISYHRNLRKSGSLHSILEDVPGIGPKRRKELFKAFGSIGAIKNARVEELASVKGMDKRAAQSLYEYIH